MAKTKSQKEAEQLELGKKLQLFYELGFVNKKQAILFSFLKGIAVGFGAFLGGTILIALLIGTLNLVHVPAAERLVQILSQSPK